MGGAGIPAGSPEQRDDTPGISPRLLIQHSTREFLGLLTLLVLGSALAAVVQTWLPRSWLLALGSAPTLSVLALMLLALVVSVCSSVDAFWRLGLLLRSPQGSVGLPVAGACGGSQARWVVHGVADAASHRVTAASASLMVLLIGQWVNLLQL